MSKPVVKKPTIKQMNFKMGMGVFPSNCGMWVWTEFAGGHRVHDDFSSKLSREHWIAQLCRRAGNANVAFTETKEQAGNRFSGQALAEFLTSEGCAVTCHKCAQYNMYYVTLTQKLQEEVFNLEEDDAYERKYITLAALGEDDDNYF